MKMYEQYWNNVRIAEELSWKVFFIYSVTMSIITFFYEYNMVNWILSLLITGLTAIAISISLNANLWFLRNMVLITRVESKFDLMDILPEKWKKFEKNFFNDEIWWLHVFLYLIISSFLCIFFISESISIENIIYFFIGLIMISIPSIWYGIHLRKRYKKLSNSRSSKKNQT